MRHLLYTAFTFLLLFNKGQAEPLVLSQDGKTEYVIVLPENPSAVELTAAKELKEHLDAVTGANFAIVKETDADTAKPQLIVGNAKRLKELLPDVDVTKIPYDGIVIKTVGKNLILVGHPQRGTLYAVNSFLEDAVGVRWWTSTESTIPKKPTLEIPPQNVEYAPKLIYREAYYLDAFDGVFASRMKCNGNMVRTTPEYGGHHRFHLFVHSFFPLLPPEKYFSDHPDWYSEIDGKRKHNQAQLCLTNDEMRAELTKNALEGLRNNPDAKFISISQNDWYGYCTCEKCKSIDDEEGSQAGTMVRFVNKVAEEIEKEFPDVWVETLAYQYTRKPPKFVKPRKNVVIRLCSIECSFVQPLDKGEQNKPFREDIQGWSKIADNLFIWDYTVNFSAYMLPHPNHRVLAPNIRFFVDNNTIGLFEQGDAGCSAGDFVRMKNWVISKLLWNPSFDESKLFDEFLMGYYGSEYGPKFKTHLNIIHDQAEQSGVYLRCFMPSTNDWLDFETWKQAYENFFAPLPHEEVFFKRFLRDTLPVTLVWMKEYYAFQRKAGGYIWLFSDPQNRIDTFFDRCKEYNVKAYREFDSPKQFETFEADMRARFGTPADPPEFCKDLPKNSWYDVQNVEFSLHKLGEWTFSVEDAAASNKRAAKMPGDHFEWATSYTFDKSLLDLVPANSPHPPSSINMAPPEGEGTPAEYRLNVAVRCDAKEGVEGNAMTLGVYDPDERKEIIHKSLSVAEIGGEEYHWIDLGTVAVRPNQQFWFAPPKRPGEVDAVYIDRIVVVRER
ncbi:MAG: DUF4838 domain-containing protein [Planctomycetaceae bacterium]|jgi:hypothetical protein|nr:DUF4838 domain-containing protein [Planctomycetaceae bacterium]